MKNRSSASNDDRDYHSYSTRAGLHSNVGRDAFGYVLGYYWDNSGAKDWEPINSGAQSLYGDADDLSDTEADDLFNGNISDMSVALMRPNVSANPTAMPVIFNRYHYDQLNRIVQQSAFTHSVNTTGYASHTNADEYKNTFTYDPNGNILTQLRNGNATDGLSMDDLAYHYYTNTNQLEYVDDGGTAGNYADDLEDQSAANYTYTPIGELLSYESEGIAQIVWDINGKIHSITRETGWSIPGTSPAEYPADLEFKYDAMGNRVCKIVKPRDVSGVLEEDTWTYTYYVRDASGNVMAVYTRNKHENVTQYNDEFTLTETHLYGGSRLAIKQREQENITSTVVYEFNGYESAAGDLYNSFLAGDEVSHDHADPPSEEDYTRTRGRKVFELTNHLGNVLVTFYDRKLSTDGNTDNVTDYYLADVASMSDYSAFGAPMPGRSFSSENYRYGMNGQEKDDEVNGTTGTSYTAEYWQYDSRLGRRWNVDPVVKPSRSSYDAFSNNPVIRIDPKGNDDYFNDKGVFLFRDNSSTTNIKVISTANWNNLKQNPLLNVGLINYNTETMKYLRDKSVNLSDVKVDNAAGNNMLRNIMMYYFDYAGLSGETGGKTHYAKNVIGGAVLTEDPYKIACTFDKPTELPSDPNEMNPYHAIFLYASSITGKVRPSMNNYYDLMNTMAHEFGHYKGGAANDDITHVNACITAASHWTWRYASAEHRDMEINYAATFLYAEPDAKIRDSYETRFEQAAGIEYDSYGWAEHVEDGKTIRKFEVKYHYTR